MVLVFQIWMCSFPQLFFPSFLVFSAWDFWPTGNTVGSQGRSMGPESIYFKIDEVLEIDGILFLEHSRIALWVMSTDHSPHTATLFAQPGTCCLETAAVGGWNCGWLAEHRCRGLAQNHWHLNVWNSKLELCGRTSRKLVMFVFFLVFLPSLWVNSCGRCNMMQWSWWIFTSQHSGATAMFVFGETKFKSDRKTIEWFGKLWRESITTTAPTGLSLYTPFSWLHQFMLLM